MPKNFTQLLLSTEIGALEVRGYRPNPVPPNSEFRWFLSFFEVCELGKSLGVVGSPSYCIHMHYRCILSIGKVSDRSNHFCLQKSTFLDRGSSRKLLTFTFEFRSKFPKSRFSCPEVHLEWSDRLHIVPTCVTHQYYRFWKFQPDRSIFANNNLDF